MGCTTGFRGVADSDHGRCTRVALVEGTDLQFAILGLPSERPIGNTHGHAVDRRGTEAQSGGVIFSRELVRPDGRLPPRRGVCVVRDDHFEESHIQAADGKFLWRDDSSSNNFANCPTPVFRDGYLFSASGWKGAALVKLIPQNHRASTQLVYANNAMRSQYGGFFLHDGYVYGCSTSILMCMNFLTGEVAWKNRSVGMGSVVYADGHFIMRGDGGTVALVEATPEQYREKGRFDQPDRSDRPARTYPVVTGGRLYLRDEGVLLCYDVREQ